MKLPRLASCMAVAFALLFGVAAPAFASIGPGVGVRLQKYTPPQAAGGAAAFSVRFEAREALTLSGFTISGPAAGAGLVTSTFPKSPLVLPRGESRVFEFSALGAAGEGEVVLRFLANGRPVVKRFDFSRANRTKHLVAPRLREQVSARADFEPPHAPGALEARPAPLPKRPEGRNPVRLGANFEHNMSARAPGSTAPQAPQGRIVRVRGSLKYERDDGVTLGADAVTFRIYDEDDLSDDLEYVGTTATNGSFDVTISFEEDEPDVYVEFETSNAHVTVEDGSLWEDNYFFETSRREDFTGSEIAYGTLMPSDDGHFPVLHIFTNIHRAWRWWAQNRSNDVQHLECQYPDGDWPHYDGEIHIPYSVDGTAFRWESDTHVHEYGHHLRHQYMVTFPPDYDNGVCNNPNGDPGHCAWCEETGHDAVNEGWPNWYADHVLSRYASEYGVAANHTRDTEQIGQCRDNNDNPCSCGRYETEGFFGTIFRDIVDDTPGENDPRSGADYYFDRVDASINDAIDVLSLPGVTNTQQFIDTFRALHPEISASDWWGTLNNAGFHLDDTIVPLPPAQFWCPSHSTQSASPDRTITVNWTPGSDSESGVRGYLLYVGETKRAPEWSDDYVYASTLEWTTPVLTPGHSYYVSIRSFDHEDNLGQWKWVGPYEIRNPEPPDLMATTPGSTWYRPLVARDAGDESGGAQPTASLPGNTAGTWLNAYARNHGELTANTVEAHFLVDGVKVDSLAAGSFSVNQGKSFLNRGPYTVRGGRHALQVYWDSDEDYSEGDEDDNLYTTQYTFLPLQMSTITTYNRAAPPMRDAGRSTMDVSQDFYWNCDGLRFEHRAGPIVPMASWWSAVALHQVDWQDDYDVHLFDRSDLSGIGFDIPRTRSSRDEGLLDAVFSNRRAHTVDSWDVGVVNADSGLGNYRARHIVSQSLALGDSVLVTQGAQVMMSLRELTVASGQSGTIEVIATMVRGTRYLYGLRFAETFEQGGIEDYLQKVATNSDGTLRMVFDVVAGDVIPLAFYRNPSSSPPESVTTFTLQVRRVLPDMVASAPTNWYAPLVPKPSLGVYTFGISAPTSLAGDVADTYLNWSYLNDSESDIPQPLHCRVRHDLTTLASPLLLFGADAGERFTTTNSGPYTLPGGRHVLSLGLDWMAEVVEEGEGNNTWAEQWVWAPDTLSFGEGQWRAGTNGVRNSLWGSLSAGEVAWPNADGVRTPVPPASTRWAGAAVLPAADRDVDLFVHEKSTGPKDGFEDFVASSEWGRGEIDYVLWNHDHTPKRQFDLGVVRITSDTASVVVQPERASSWTNLALSHAGIISAGDILDLVEFDLPAGIHRFDLTQTGTPVDFGMALHAPGSAYSGRSDGAALGSAWLAPEGAAETFTVTITTPGRHVIAVWKVSQAEVAEAGRYTLRLTSGTAEVATGLPVATRLAWASPNPSARSTAIRFDLARESDVELDVYDMRGARVATLVSGRQAAGAHEVTWDGRGGDGRRSPAGVYLARLRAGSFSGTLKLVRVE